MLRFNSALRTLSLFFIPLLLISAIYYVGSLEYLFQQHPSLSWLIVIDLLLLIPFISFLILRKSNANNLTVVPIIIVCMLLGYLILPVSSIRYLDLFKTWIFPLIELTAVSLIIYKINMLFRQLKKARQSTPDFYTALKLVTSKYVPKPLLGMVITEIAVIYYGFINWKKPIINNNEFSYHKNSGSLSLMGAFLFLIPFEAFVLHIFIEKFSILLAWILTGISMYSVFQILGFIRSIPKRPIIVAKDKLYLRYGILAEIEIDYRNIEAARISSGEIKDTKSFKTLSPLGSIEGYNIIIELKEPQNLSQLYGFKKSINTLGVLVDEQQQFLTELKHQMEVHTS